jgi:hypothetical protein
MSIPLPLTQRRGDILIVAFFLLNLCYITYMVDLEQLVIPDPAHFTYPVWPPRFAVDADHSWGRAYDPLLLARPVWWKMTIWIDALVFGPFYAVAIYAYSKGREWIRIPSIMYASVMLTNVTIILGEEVAGPHRTPQLPMVLLANAAWVLIPLFILYRMAPRAHPFMAPMTAPPRTPPLYDGQVGRADQRVR